ncbi:uncharacterized protein LOC116417120 [Nasonia vitripennis]|uniref:DUF4371 domain-containing protein n=1 Tax=Nasonia vitripennis TaxID=7425 RepID=A0A7M7QE56_NASVI|nr:uncharacterized protein LOC116417120 [Nasonia vitripennis]
MTWGTLMNPLSLADWPNSVSVKTKPATKPQKVRVYKYNSSWENETWAKGWLVKNRDNHNANQQAFCKLCRKPLRAHPTDLEAHSKRDSHVKLFESLAAENQPKITTVCKTQTDKKKENHERDLILAAYIATHSSIRGVDHLSEILKDLKVIEDLRLHKTKCRNLIKYVIAPNMLQELIEDVGDWGYSLIVDESTDVATMKFLCLCIKYFSHKQNRIVTAYLSLIEVVKADANTLCYAIIEYCKKN